MSMISKLVKIAEHLDKSGRYEDADVVTHIAERLTVEAGIARELERFNYPETQHDPGPLGYEEKYGEPIYEPEVWTYSEDMDQDLGTGEDLYFTPTQSQQVAWENAEGGYPIYRDVPVGRYTWKMKAGKPEETLSRARSARELLDRYHRRYDPDNIGTQPREFASDEEGTFEMPSIYENVPISVRVTKGRPYSYRAYEGYR